MINCLIYKLITPPLIKKMDKNGGGIIDDTYIYTNPWAFFINGQRLTDEDYKQFKELKQQGKISEGHLIEQNFANSKGLYVKTQPVYKYTA